ncbi:MAG: hypothetical protein H6741_17315 [Alphaproteobacteria bacterium]|nr:hypothetical protein [Alphaproteobacteria bacterium]MCB9794477.1 hypothetical protein [Alphaproteobacteria bacterium]
MLPLALLIACVHVEREVDLDRAGPLDARVSVERDELPARKLPELINTTWRLDTVVPGSGPVRYEVTLRPSGHLESYSARDSTPDDDDWWVDGKELVLSMNRGYVDYRGAFEDSETVVGEALNQRGERWGFTLRRVDQVY